MKTLVIFSHGYQAQSVSNVAIADEFAKAGFEVRNLEVLYPNGTIDVAVEQAAVEAADVIIFQHPIFWYSLTPMLKKWQDEVQTYGWAYGSETAKMKGKKFIHSYTTGAPREVYSDDAVKDLSASLRLSAGFTGMDFVGSFGKFGQLAMTNPNAKEDAIAYAQEVIAFVKGL